MTKYKLYAIDESSRSQINTAAEVSYKDRMELQALRRSNRADELSKALKLSENPKEKAVLDRGIGAWFRYFNCHTTKNIGVIVINEELLHEMDWYGVSYKEIVFALKAFEEDEEINTILLDVNSPGGEVSGLMELANEFKLCKKPIYAYCEGLTASAGMLIASCAKRIYTTESTVLGSIGVMAVAYKYDKAYEKFGIERKIFRSPHAKNKNLDPFGKEGQEEVEKSIKETEEMFLATLANNRGVTLEDAIEKFGQGLTFHAKEAIERGLADEIVADFDDCIAKILPSEAEGGGIVMASEKLTIETLKAQYPELASSLVKEGHTAGFEEGRKDGIVEGTTAERKRIVSLEELRGTSAADNSIIEKAISNGDTAEIACVAIVKEQLKNPQQKPPSENTKVEDLVGESAEDNVKPVVATGDEVKVKASVDAAVGAIDKANANKKA